MRKRRPRISRYFGNALRRWSVAAAIGGGFLIGLAIILCATEVWTATGSGVWSNGANWQSGFPPLPAGSSALALQFNASDNAAYTATNDFPAGFIFNQLTLDGDAGTVITVDGGAASPATFAGTNPGLQNNGSGSATVTNFATPTTGNLTINEVGSGNLTLSSISGGGGLIFNTTIFDLNVNLVGVNSYTGPTQVAQGSVSISGDAALGAGNGAVLLGSTNPNVYAELSLLGNWTTSRAVTINTGSYLNLNGFNATLNNVLTGTEGLVQLGAGTLTLTASNPYSGGVNIEGTLRLAGAGTIASTVMSVNGLTLDDSAQYVANRFPSNASLYLGGEFAEIGNPNFVVNRTLPAITFEGSQETFAVVSAGTPGVTLDTPSLNLNGSFLLVRGDQLGGSGAGSSRVFFDSLSNLAPRTMLANVFADDTSSGGGSSFAIYDPATGVRTLHADEYTTGSTIQNPENGGATPHSANFLGSGAVGLGGNTDTVKTLTLESGTTLTLNPGQFLQVTNGLLIRAGSPSTITGSGAISFGLGSGTLFNAGNLEVSATLESGLGVTKMGAGVLTLDNFSGTLIVDAGSVQPGSATALAKSTVEAYGTLDLSGMPGAIVGSVSGGGDLSIGSNTVTIGALGTDMRFYGEILGSGTVNIEDPGSGQAFRELGSAVGFTGNLVLHSGQLSVLSSLSGATTILDGGSIRAGYSTTTFDSPTILNGTVTAIGRYPVSFVGGATLSGPGSFVVRGSGGANIQIAATYSGDTMVSYGTGGDQDGYAGTPGNLTVSGAAGSILNTSAVRLYGGHIVFDNSTLLSGGAGGRVGDLTPIFLESGTFELDGNASTVVSESIGKMAAAGYSTVLVGASSDAATQLAVGSLDRTSRGDYLLSGNKLGSTPGSHVATIISSVPPTLVGGGGTGPQTSIIPYAVGIDSSAVSHLYLVTYNSTNGIQPLTSSDVLNTFTGASGLTNVAISGSATTASLTAVNALSMQNASISGSGAIQPVSGLIVGSGSIASPVDFGGSEGNVITPTLASMTFSGTVSGSNGLTKAGPGTLTLSGANTFTGTLTIDGGMISISSPSNLGPSTAPIVVFADGNGAGLNFTGELTFNRPIVVGSGLVNFTGTATVNSQISGAGGVVLGGNGASSITLTGNNTYTGPTVVSNGLSFSSDPALGSGGALIFATVPSTGSSAPTVTLLGDWSATRLVDIESQSATLNTNGFNATLSGPLAGGRFFSGSETLLTKSGAGTLNLLGTSLYGGGLKITGGMVDVGPFGAVGAVTVGANGVLSGSGVVGQTNVSGTLAPGDASGYVLTIDGGLTFSTSALAVNLVAPALFDEVNVNGTVTLNSVVSLSVNLEYDPTDFVDSFEIIDNESASPIAMGASCGLSFNGQLLPEGGVFTDGTQAFQITYVGGDGNDVVIKAVPEPSTALFLAIGMVSVRRVRTPGRRDRCSQR